jgi:large subunit ribosomal protein L3
MTSPRAILGTKLGMTQVFDEQARAIPVTVVKAGPVQVVQIKTKKKDGYDAVQISYGELKPGQATKPEAGHYAKAGVAPARHLVEIKVDDPESYQLGQEIRVTEVFEAGTKADVSGVSKGKGFAGVMKRHNFAGQGASHGNHKSTGHPARSAPAPPRPGCSRGCRWRVGWVARRSPPSTSTSSGSTPSGASSSSVARFPGPRAPWSWSERR